MRWKAEIKEMNFKKNHRKNIFFVEKNDFENFDFRRKKYFSRKIKKIEKILNFPKSEILKILGFFRCFEKNIFSKIEIFKIIFLHEKKIFFEMDFFLTQSMSALQGFML